MKQYIILSNLRFFAYHGVMAQEKQVGHYFNVSLKIEYDFSKALKSDKIKDTLNYGEVFQIVKQEMNNPSKLMEHLAGRILNTLFQKFEPVSNIKIKIIKENPPINADCDGCGIELECSRNDFNDFNISDTSI